MERTRRNAKRYPFFTENFSTETRTFALERAGGPEALPGGGEAEAPPKKKRRAGSRRVAGSFALSFFTAAAIFCCIAAMSVADRNTRKTGGFGSGEQVFSVKGEDGGLTVTVFGETLRIPAKAVGAVKGFFSRLGKAAEALESGVSRAARLFAKAAAPIYSKYLIFVSASAFAIIF